jgi:hypothetical protein
LREQPERKVSPESVIAQRRGHCSRRFLPMRVSNYLRASISSLSLVYYLWTTNRDSLTEACPLLHARWIEFQDKIASYRFEDA